MHIELRKALGKEGAPARAKDWMSASVKAKNRRYSVELSTTQGELLLTTSWACSSHLHAVRYGLDVILHGLTARSSCIDRFEHRTAKLKSTNMRN